MNEQELRQRLDILDGIQKAHMVTLRLLLRSDPAMADRLHAFAQQVDRNPAPGVSDECHGAMRDHLLMLAGPT